MAGPNSYSLQGSQLSIGYNTGVAVGLGAFFYQDAFQTLTFAQDQLRVVTSEIGTLLTVTLRITPDLGSTSFTLVVPTVSGQGLEAPIPIQTLGVTTLHRLFLGRGPSQEQTELYTVTALAGTARYIPL